MNMRERPVVAVLLCAILLLATGRSADRANPPKLGKVTVAEGPAVLWREPSDIESRDLFYGPGGKSHEPHGDLTFLSEDTTGSSPKFEAVDEEGLHWKVKLGIEAKPETAASRLVWAAGYFANEDYFVREIRVRNLPHLHRGGHYVSAGGLVHDVRLKRHSPNEKKLGIWQWSNNPFHGAREWNGLRALMALLNNWDLKDVNNAIYQTKAAQPEQHYLVSDLGASLGTTYLNRPLKGDLRSYEESKWINTVTADHVDFGVPGQPPVGYIFAVPLLVQRMELVWIGRGVPRADVAWLGHLLARLSSNQIRDAFRASGYSSDEVERFSRVVERRIDEIKRL
jgi:hypothetical protein